LRQPDVNQGVNDYKNSTGAVLLDVRTPEEYSKGHIPESKNIPLQTLDKVRTVVENKNTELFVYCYSGARSRQAAALLGQRGYTSAHVKLHQNVSDDAFKTVVQDVGYELTGIE